MMPNFRKIKRVLKSKPVVEGAGVHLKRVFGNPEVPLLDPFLLLDDFHSSNPEDYKAGFPWHPHRGIETITYMLYGEVEHADSMGNKGVIRAGDVQWMTAGSGIIHQEMPQVSDPMLWGFQLWANLPASHKMIDPRYRGISQDEIPEVTPIEGVRIKIISGSVAGVSGPVQDVVIDPEYLDVTIEPGTVYEHPIKEGHTAFSYVIDGQASFDTAGSEPIHPETLALFDNGNRIQITTSDQPVQFLMISGKPLQEAIAWGGPIVMNTRKELEVAFEEYQNGTFIKFKP